METENPNVVDSALAAAAKPTTLDVNGIPHVALPVGYTLDSRESLLDVPARAKGSVQLHDTASFIAYVNALKAPFTTRIYCNADYLQGKVSLAAVFNDHTNGEDAGWRDLRATYSPRKTPEWQRWIGADRTPQSQEEFATFIEDNLRDIADVDGMPTGGQMLKMALDLEVTHDSRFKSSVRPQSGGVELTFVAKDNDATVKKMAVFERFAIGIAPFMNGPMYQVTARLRYRVREAQLSFWYELIRPDLTLADAVKSELAKIGEQTNITPLFGEP